MSLDVLKYLKSRGVIKAQTHPELDEFLKKDPVTLYAGFDPTADSLHVGTLSVIVNLRRFIRFGHRVIVLIGGATALLGDPSGKDEERKLRTREEVEGFSASIKAELSRFFDPEKTIFLNNLDWIDHLNILDYLRDCGKVFSVKEMISRDFIRERLAKDKRLSFTEFSYLTFQAYDFLHLHTNYDCVLQIGGSDQWGNILSGMDLIRVRADKGRSRQPAFGLTTHLIERSDGSKFAMSEGGNIWLSKDKTEVHDFYQFWFQTRDEDTLKFLNAFTDIDGEEMEDLKKAFGEDPSSHRVHDRLALEITSLVHGEEAARGAQASAAIIRTGMVVDETVDFAPQTPITGERIASGLSVAEAFVMSGLLPGKKEVRRRAESGAIKVNGEVKERVTQALTLADFDDKGRCLLLFGKKKIHVLILK